MYKNIILATVLSVGAAFAQDDIDPQFGQGMPQGPGFGQAGPQGRPGMGGHRGQRPGFGNFGGRRMDPDMMVLAETLFMEKYDADKDGKISDQEREAVKTDVKKVQDARQAEMLKKFDKDGDGQISDEERNAMREEFMKNRPQRERGNRGPQGGPQGRPNFGQGGPQGRPNFGQGGPQGRPDMGGNRGQRPGAGNFGGRRFDPDMMVLAETLFMAKYDADKDGKISDKEREAVKADVKKVQDARQAEMMKKFDKDGDGKISDEERNAMREEFMKNRPQRGARGPQGAPGAEQPAAE